jgi:hypothetical protein
VTPLWSNLENVHQLCDIPVFIDNLGSGWSAALSACVRNPRASSKELPTVETIGS